ncbi:MAG TPA: hypothetical protein VN181_00960, partial [Thermoanaerobaculia bacterium]|nr:hypothetical protein [Thermoanaerobaculia bacterium]
TAQVADGDESHLVELPITIDPVTLTTQPITANFSISAVNVADYTGKSVFVRGAKVNITTPLQLADLILVDGATISTLEETKVDLTITDHLFIDADSKIDVTGKGYLGGFRSREGGGLSNSSATGRTYPGTTTGGTSPASDASYAGIGGGTDEQTNATYGSITEPVDFGSGGGGISGRGGTNGGGALLLRGGTGLARFVVAGALHADGEEGDYGYLWTSGSGGTINLRARTLITSKWTRVTANGADEGPGTDDASGSGGGRIAIRVTDRYDVNATLPILQVRGGRNAYFYPAEGSQYVDGGAGTIYLVRPNAAQGELIVSNYDERFPTTQHRSGGTPLKGTLNFDAITVGPRALARFDDPYTIPTPNDLKVDGSALVLSPTDVPQINVTSTTPAANAQIAQSTSVTATYTAQGLAGIARVNTILSVQPADVVAKFSARPTFVPSTNTTITVPSSAAPGDTTFKLRVLDRSGRVAETAPITFSVVTNAAPSITQFDVTPASMFANHTITVAGAATDDIAVTSLALTSSNGTVTSQTPVASGASTTRAFTVAVPPTAVPGTPITLTLAALDAFPNRVATTQVKTVEILHDTVAPSFTFNKP